MNKRVKECLKLCSSHGLVVKSHSINKHLKIVTDAGLIIFALSPSDYRWKLQARTTIRRLAREIKIAA